VIEHRSAGGGTIGSDARRRAAEVGEEAPDPWGVALKLLAMRARSTQEIRERLSRRGYASAEVEAVVRRLTAAGYLDDAGYARAWARSRAHRVGPARLARELRARGISAADVAAVLGELAGERDLRHAASEAAARKLHALRGMAPAVIRRRLAAHLLRQGFTTDIVLDLLRECLPETEE
jgi:regulatory protein